MTLYVKFSFVFGVIKMGKFLFLGFFVYFICGGLIFFCIVYFFRGIGFKRGCFFCFKGLVVVLNFSWDELGLYSRVKVYSYFFI